MRPLLIVKSGKTLPELRRAARRLRRLDRSRHGARAVAHPDRPGLRGCAAARARFARRRRRHGLLRDGEPPRAVERAHRRLARVRRARRNAGARHLLRPSAARARPRRSRRTQSARARDRQHRGHACTPRRAAMRSSAGCRRRCAHAGDATSRRCSTLPPGARLLASSRGDPHQAFAVGDHAWGVQFHPEFDADVVRAYLEARRDAVRAEGLDPDALLARRERQPARRPRCCAALPACCATDAHGPRLR